jgi:hypothetical protein
MSFTEQTGMRQIVAERHAGSSDSIRSREAAKGRQKDGSSRRAPLRATVTNNNNNNQQQQYNGTTNK